MLTSCNLPSMFPQVEIDIDGTGYRLTLLPSKLGRPMLLRLSQLLSQGSDRAAMLGSDSAMLTGAVLALTEAELQSTWEKFETRTEVMASEGYVSLNVVYEPAKGGLTDYGLMLALIEAHIDANFSSFFAKARQMMAASRAKASSAFPTK